MIVEPFSYYTLALPDDLTLWTVPAYERLVTQPYYWVIEVEERCVGYACLHSLDEQNRRARFAIGIFDSTMWGKGYGTKATQLVLKHAFDVLALHRVDLRVLAFNKRAIVCYEKCGFVQEGVEREGAFIGGNGKVMC